MAEYLHPGVYVEEIERGPKPMEGVPTSTAAMLGESERGCITPRLITSYKEYQRWFGDTFADQKYLPHAVHGFFENGGKRAYICRIAGENCQTAEWAIDKYFSIRASGPGEWGNRVFAKITPSTKKNSHGDAVGFRVRFAYWPAGVEILDPFTDASSKQSPQPVVIEDFDNLVTTESSADYYGKRLPFIDLDTGKMHEGRDSSALAVLVRNSGALPDTRPADGFSALGGGTEHASELTVNDYNGVRAGTRTSNQGLAALELDDYRDVALVYAPNVSNDIAKEIISHCEKNRFRFAVIDSANLSPSFEPRDSIADSSYAAYYYPWITVAPVHGGAQISVPPGGHVLGVYARVDTEHGVHKAPANEVVHGALALQTNINDALQEVLNPKGVNALRTFVARGIRVWGARTLSSDPLWKYVNVRRLFIFLEHSIYDGTQWVVFEPNDDRLWDRVKDTIRLFLRSQWSMGALQGRTEKDAFFVTCDRTTMTQDDILNGRLICEIGIAPVKPAEFIILRIFQHAAQPTCSDPP